MVDFDFIQNKLNGKWVISAPRRASRTNVENEEAICPFCPGSEVKDEELYQIGEGSDWKIRVIKNKFPFAPNHEVIIHSPDHHKNWDELPFLQVELIISTYRKRFITHKKDGQIYIFHNRGYASGESLPHPHTQLVVIPHNVKLDITSLDPSIYRHFGKHSASRISNMSDPGHGQDDLKTKDILETEHFLIFCPPTSEWPDEAWIAPKQNGGGFGMIKDEEITDMSFVLSRLVQIFDQRHGHEFPFNFYIPPLKNWYLRLIPRTKIIGGFELGTNLVINTQDPGETFEFIQEHFWQPDHEKIRSTHQAKYHKTV